MHKRYTISLVIFLFLEMMLMVMTTFYLEPPEGDTTRLSGYSENDFGWNKPKKIFEKPIQPLQDFYDHYSDVLVVGDSFSFGGVLNMMNYPWQTFLTANTGWSVSTISHYTTKTNPPSYDPTLLPSIVNSETFKKTPPKVFVLEVVERQLDILPKFPGVCKNQNHLDEPFSLPIKPISDLTPNLQVVRLKKKPIFTKQIAYSQKYWWSFFQFNSGHNQAYLFKLNKLNLFSSKVNDRLLVYEGDVKKKNWNDKLLESISCTLINMQNFVQENGKTFFVVMIAPDKLTAYSPFLKDQSLVNINAIQRLKTDKALHIPRFDLPIQNQIDKGVMDVYLSNDTHWADEGQKSAADTLTNYLLEITAKQTK